MEGQKALEVDDQDKFDFHAAFHVQYGRHFKPHHIGDVISSEFYQQIVRALGAPQLAGVKVGDVKGQALPLIEQQHVEMLILEKMDYILTSRSVKPIEARMML